MNFQFYLEKLFNSAEFQKFKSENPDAFLCSGFFTIDKEGSDNQQHLDYWVPSAKKLFSFKLNFNPIEMLPAEVYNDFIPSEISDNIQFDLAEIEKLIQEKILEEKVNNRAQKIILSLQNSEGKNYLLVTAFLSNLGLLKATLDLDKKTITDFEKKSFFDMLQFMGKKK